MIRILVALCLFTTSQVPDPAPKPPWKSPVPYPKGMEFYYGTLWTQEIAVTNGFDRITPVRRSGQKVKWQFSGGLAEVQTSEWVSEKYKLIPGAVLTWVDNIAVKNSFGHYQYNRGIVRSYPDGTRFDDVLSNKKGVVFEHRSLQKVKGEWQSKVLYTDKDARPKGYNGLKQSCQSCHSEAGSGGYAEGLVPGGDHVLSDPLDWTILQRR